MENYLLVGLIDSGFLGGSSRPLLYKPMLTNDIASQCLIYLGKGGIFYIAFTLPKKKRKRKKTTRDTISNMHPGPLDLILLIGNI